MDGIEICVPATLDLVGLAGIEQAAAARFASYHVPDPSATLAPEALHQAHVDQTLWVAEYCAKPIGFACALVKARYLHLLELSVRPAYGRRGIGRALLTQVLAETTSRALNATVLTTFAGVVWNAPFYARSGFVVLHTDDMPSFVRDTLQAETASGGPARVAMAHWHQLP